MLSFALLQHAADVIKHAILGVPAATSADSVVDDVLTSTLSRQALPELRAIFSAAAAAGLGQQQPAAQGSGLLSGAANSSSAAAHVSAGGASPQAAAGSGGGRSRESTPSEDEQAQHSAFSRASSANEAANELTMKDMPTAAVATELARLSAGGGGNRDAERDSSVHFRPRQVQPQVEAKPKKLTQSHNWQ